MLPAENISTAALDTSDANLAFALPAAVFVFLLKSPGHFESANGPNLDHGPVELLSPGGQLFILGILGEAHAAHASELFSS